MTSLRDPRPEDRVRAAIDRSWVQSQRHWSRFVMLRYPIDQPDQESIAQIERTYRRGEGAQVTVRYSVNGRPEQLWSWPTRGGA